MFPLKDTIHSKTFPIINWLIIIANVLVFVLIELHLNASQSDRFFLTWGLVPARITSGLPAAWLTIFSSMFLHGGWLHIISNLWALFIFGDNVEDRMGSFRYLVFYLLSGVAAGLLQVYLSPHSPVPSIGASGAIAGVLAAYLVLYPTARVSTLILLIFIPIFVQVPAFIFLIFWFVTQFYSGLSTLGANVNTGVAYWAHVGGFIFGLLMVLPFSRRPRAYVRSYPDEYHPW